MSACAGGSVERTAWRLSEPPNGRSLELGVFSGHSSCLDYDRVEAEETDDSVLIRAYVRYNGGDCTDDFVTERVKVALDQPLGDRRLDGCTGPAVEWDAFDGGSGECREPFEF
jgi:hypothetical protein